MKNLITRFNKEKKEVAYIDDADADIDNLVEECLQDVTVGKSGFIERDDVIYVKPCDLRSESCLEDIVEEIGRGNIIILDISVTPEKSTELYNKVHNLKKYCIDNGIELCAVSGSKLMILPDGIEVVSRSTLSGKE